MKGTPHQLDVNNCKVAVLSDLHKYSGVSDFSKGDNPFFVAYYTLYKEMQLGVIDKAIEKLNDKEKREIEHAIKKALPKEKIEQQIQLLLTPEERRQLQKSIDGSGKWQRRQEVFESFANSDYVVFNGDIFDIECCKNPKEKIEEAVDWLRDRMDSAPNTQFHFVLGNHESFIKFIKAMEQLETDGGYKKRFHFHEHYFRLNDSLFVHGDEYLGVPKYVKAFNSAPKHSEGAENNIPGIELKSNENNRRRELKDLNPVFRTAYEWVNGTYHRTQNIWHGQHAIVSKLYDEIEKSDLEGLKEAFIKSKHIFSGHTHEPYCTHFKDKTFYNTGAAVTSRFSAFRPLSIQMEAGQNTHIEPLLQDDKVTAHQRPISNFNRQNIKKYCVLSDLHIGGCVSRYDLQPSVKLAIDNAINNADVVVLNGDIFELFEVADVKKAINNSVDWLKKLITDHPGKEVHYILGNHEAVLEFKKAVQAIRSNHFVFHEHAFQTEDKKTVFLHGDEAVQGAFIKREMYNITTARASSAELFANQRLAKSAIKVMARVRNPNNASKFISRAIHYIPEIEQPQNVQNIFFGHTHVPFIDYTSEHRRKWVTNTGTATLEAPFAGVEFEMARNGTILNQKLLIIQWIWELLPFHHITSVNYAKPK